MTRPQETPDWLAPLVDACRAVGPEEVPFRRRPTGSGARDAAVLVLAAHTEDGPDLLLTERAAALRAHAGQAAFPGGTIDPDDAGPVDAALREAREETGLDPDDVVPLAVLPALTIPVTGFAVTPVIAHWVRPGPVRVVDPGETAAVVRIPVAALVDPAGRFRVRGPSGHVGPAFAAGGLLIWGFTAGLLDWLLSLAGWAGPWDTDDVRDLDDVWARRGDLSRPEPAGAYRTDPVARRGSAASPDPLVPLGSVACPDPTVPVRCAPGHDESVGLRSTGCSDMTAEGGSSR